MVWHLGRSVAGHQMAWRYRKKRWKEDRCPILRREELPRSYRLDWPLFHRRGFPGCCVRRGNPSWRNRDHPVRRPSHYRSSPCCFSILEILGRFDYATASRETRKLGRRSDQRCLTRVLRLRTSFSPNDCPNGLIWSEQGIGKSFTRQRLLHCVSRDRRQFRRQDVECFYTPVPCSV